MDIFVVNSLKFNNKGNKNLFWTCEASHIKSFQIKISGWGLIKKSCFGPVRQVSQKILPN